MDELEYMSEEDEYWSSYFASLEEEYYLRIENE